MNTLSKLSLPTSVFSKITAALFICLFQVAVVNATLLDKVIAVVNDDIITMSELDAEAEQYEQKIREKAPADQQASALEQMRQEVLEDLIEKRLLMQKANEMNLKITADEFNTAYEQMVASNNMTKEQFIATLEQNGMSASFHKELFRTQMLEAKLINYEIRSKIVVTEEMIIEYFDDKYTKTISDGGYYLLQIGFVRDTKSADSDKLKNEALALAQRVHNLAKDGKDFKTLAKKFSQLPSAKDGGDIGAFSADEMSADMRDAIVSLPQNDVTDIIETASGFQFFKVASSKKGNVVTQVPYESVKEDIRKMLFNKELQQEYDKWIKNLRDSAYIEIL